MGRYAATESRSIAHRFFRRVSASPTFLLLTDRLTEPTPASTLTGRSQVLAHTLPQLVRGHVHRDLGPVLDGLQLTLDLRGGIAARLLVRAQVEPSMQPWALPEERVRRVLLPPKVPRERPREEAKRWEALRVAACKGVAGQQRAAGGCLDILVHNAGITRDKTLAKMDEQRWDLTIDVNLSSVIAVTETLLKDGTVPDGGRVVLVSSIAGIAGNAGQTNYAASKSGIVGLTRHLGCVLADRDIAVNAVAPGFIETRLTHAIPFTIREVGRRFSNLNQGGLPVDVAEAITFFSTPGAGGLHGNVLRVCGGNLLGA